MKTEVIYSENDITIEEYKILRENAGWKSLPDEQIKESLLGTNYLVVARVEASIIGMARCISDGRYMTYIYDVVVLDQYRSRGIGKKMIETIIDHYRNMTQNLMQFVLVAIDSDAEAFYKKIGFKKYPNLLSGPGMGMWINGKPY